jgi:PGF-CTERM protein
VWTEQAFPEQLAEMQALQIQVDICDAADNIILLGGDGISFSPDYLQIDAGESVCWTWTDIALDHNVRQVSVEGETQGMAGGFGVETPDSDVWYTFVFNDNGTYPYICEPHSLIGMTGTIQVGLVPEPEPEPEPIHDDPEEKTPGFGIGLGVIALLGAAMRAQRRND